MSEQDIEISEAQQKYNPNSTNARSISCDQVAWMLDVFDRYLPRESLPAVSRLRDMKKYGMLYEIMEVANLKFEDDSARWNGTPNEVRDY